MNILKSFCCVCFSFKNNLKTISHRNNIYEIHFGKLLQDIPDSIKLTNKEKLICVNCCDTIDEFSNFVEKCLMNYDMFLKRLSENQYRSNFQANIEESSTDIDLSMNNIIKTEPVDTDEVTNNTNNITIDNTNNLVSKLEIDNHFDENDLSITCKREGDTFFYTTTNNIINTATVDKANNCSTENIKLDKLNDIKLELTDNIVSPLNEINEICHEEEYPFAYKTRIQNDDSLNRSYKTTVISKDVVENDPLAEEDATYIKSEMLDVEKDDLMEFEEKFLCEDIKLDKTDVGLINEDTKEFEESGEDSIKSNPLDVENPNNFSNINVDTGVKPLSCDQCDETFTDSSSFINHKKSHTADKPYTCTDCGKQFATSIGCDKHKRIHTGKMPYSCEQCGKTYTNYLSLEKHLKIHSSNFDYSCEQCGKTYINYYSLDKHLKTHATNIDLSCEQCGKIFNKVESLVRHKQIHTRGKPYSCTYCDKRFRNCSLLNNHKRTHTGEKPFSCDQCDKTFTQQSSLNHHKKYHADYKPYACDQCDKAFFEKACLNQHRKIHTGEKPYSCEECGKTFVKGSELTVHKRSHTGETPFECEHCGKRFKSSSNCTSHKKIHAEQRPFPCDQCDKAFTRLSRLTQHKKVHSL